MNWSQQARMVSSVNELTSTEDCTEAVLVHERPHWAPGAAFGGFVAVVILGFVFRPLVDLVMPMTMVVILVPMNFSGRKWIVARNGQSVLLAESPLLQPRAIRIVEEVPAPISDPPSGGVVTKWFLLFDRRVRLPRFHEGTLQRVIGG